MSLKLILDSECSEQNRYNYDARYLFLFEPHTGKRTQSFFYTHNRFLVEILTPVVLDWEQLFKFPVFCELNIINLISIMIH